MLVIQLLDFKWTRDAPFPSVAALARRLGLTDRAVRDALKRLDELNLIKRESRHNSSGGRSSNRYVFDGLFERLEAMIAADAAAKAKAAPGKPGEAARPEGEALDD